MRARTLEMYVAGRSHGVLSLPNVVLLRILSLPIANPNCFCTRCPLLSAVLDQVFFHWFLRQFDPNREQIRFLCGLRAERGTRERTRVHAPKPAQFKQHFPHLWLCPQEKVVRDRVHIAGENCCITSLSIQLISIEVKWPHYPAIDCFPCAVPPSIVRLKGKIPFLKVASCFWHVLLPSLFSHSCTSRENPLLCRLPIVCNFFVLFMEETSNVTQLVLCFPPDVVRTFFVNLSSHLCNEEKNALFVLFIKLSKTTFVMFYHKTYVAQSFMKGYLKMDGCVLPLSRPTVAAACIFEKQFGNKFLQAERTAVSHIPSKSYMATVNRSQEIWPRANVGG